MRPEILDTLCPSDPRAVRSRRDLRLINGFMRGERWIADQLCQCPSARILELGAGEGTLSSLLQARFPERQVVALDLHPRPTEVPPQVQWITGDLLAHHDFRATDIVVANLFLHHLSAPSLHLLAERLRPVQGIVCSEPYRARLPLAMGRCLTPWINDVTRHDMRVSIRAGFRRGELPHLMGAHWQWHESRGVFGGLRTMGVRA